MNSDSKQYNPLHFRSREVLAEALRSGVGIEPFHVGDGNHKGAFVGHQGNKLFGLSTIGKDFNPSR